MTDAELRRRVECTDRFIEQQRDAIDTAVVDPESLCADDMRAGLQRLSALDAVPYVTMCNLATINKAMRGTFLSVLEVHLMAVGGGPTLEFVDATAFLATFQPAIDLVLRRRIN